MAAWRQAQTRPAPLPEAFWVSAAALARTLGFSRVARTLGLGYYQLRDRLAPTVPAGFVELSPPAQPTPVAAAMVVELRDGGGGQLTVRLAHDPATLRALAADVLHRQACVSQPPERRKLGGYENDSPKIRNHP